MKILWVEQTVYQSTLSFSPLVVLATWLHVAALQRIQGKWA
jgi:hypothetical protein